MLDRTLQFAARVVRLAGKLPNRVEGWVIGKQVLRSATSIGANYREAQRARSRSEFYSKIQICLQEAEETRYWFQVLEAGGLFASKELANLHSEASELVAIFTAISKKTIAAAKVTKAPDPASESVLSH
ncbi:four helix bundle protein [bacterium]|nr:four helix bundle protein [bacterium]